MTQTSSTDKISCISHRANTRFFVIYEDFLEIASVSEHRYKLAAFWRVLETKTNDRKVYNEALVEKAHKEGQPVPETSLWIELSYGDCVTRALGVFQHSSFQIAAAESERLGFSKSRVLQRRRRPGDETSPLEDYKEYLFDTEAMQKALSTGEYPTPVEINSPLLKSIAVRKETKKRKRAIENNSTPVEINTGAIEINNNKYITESNNDTDTISMGSTGDVAIAHHAHAPTLSENETHSHEQGETDHVGDDPTEPASLRAGSDRVPDAVPDQRDQRSVPGSKTTPRGDQPASARAGRKDRGSQPRAAQSGVRPGLYESDRPASAEPSYSPNDAKPTGRGAKPPVDEAPVTPIVYAYPESGVPWSTTKCLQYFRAWRGAELIGKHNLAKAAQCAKALAESYSEEVVLKVHAAMNKDSYWIAQGGADICNVANNISKEVRKLRNVKEASPAQTSSPQPEPPKIAPVPERTAEEKAAAEEKKRRILAQMQEPVQASSPVTVVRAMPKLPKEVLYGHR